MKLAAFKNAIREALLEVPKPSIYTRLQKDLPPTQNPFQGQCAEATEAGYVLGQFLFGRPFSHRFKAYKNKVKGPTSHYWLANPQDPDDACDLTDHKSDADFDYASRQAVSHINQKRTRGDIRKASVSRIYDLALGKFQRNNA